MSRRRRRSAQRAAIAPPQWTASSPLRPSAPLPLCSAKTRLATAALLMAGLALAGVWYGRVAFNLITLGPFGPTALFAFVAIVALAVMLRPVVAAIASVGRTLADHRRIATAVVTLASFAFLFATARGQGRPLHPYVHDEFSYLIQAHQLARFHGWMPAHPLAPFFDSFQLLDAPVYASAYFPGTALLYVPGIWLGPPPWITSLAVAAGVAGLLFRVAVELLDGPGAVAAVLLLWSDGRYRMLSIMTLAQMPLLLWGLAATVAWLKWRSTCRPAWSLALGTTLGMAALTRPVDALCFAIPIGLDVIGSALVRAKPTPGLKHAEDPGPGRASDPASRPPRRRRLPPLALMLAAPLPFLIVQLTLDRGITGHWTETPFRLYADRDYPGTAYGFHRFDPAARPASRLPQKQALYAEYRPVIADHTPASAVDSLFHAHASGGTDLSLARIELTLVRIPSLPLMLLLPLLPVALAGLTRRRAVVLAAVPLFPLLYVGYVFFFPTTR